MTQKQKREVIRILKADCKLQKKYINDNGQTCAIGALALAAGVKPSVLRKAGAEFISPDPFVKDSANSAILTMRSAIKRRFDMCGSDMRNIQDINDIYSDHKERVRSVLQYVSTMHCNTFRRDQPAGLTKGNKHATRKKDAKAKGAAVTAGH